MLTAVTTATAVSQDDLEQEVRERLRREAVVAHATSDDAPESSRNDGIKTKTSSRSCRLVALIVIVASVVVGVTLIAVLTTGNSSDAANTTNSPPRAWTPDELKDFIIGELGTSRGFELPGFTPAKASYELILAGGVFDHVTLGTQLMDAYVVLALWAGTGGSNGWTRSDGWNQNPHPCTWYGIGCNERGRVAEISLPGNNLIGPFNPDLQYLAGELTHLDVSDNKVGLFKFNLTSLPNLQHFNFSKNVNGGLTIEDVMHYNLTRLEVLDLSSCLLGGPISPDIERLSLLRQLHLQDNSLTGSIPSEMATLSSLTSLRLEDNKLSGSIPADVCSQVAESGENASVSVDCADVACTCCFCETS
jgi:Leucine Rich Repeat